MKRIFLVMLTLFLLMGCGGKQLVWVDVDEASGDDTAVSQPIEPQDEDEAVDETAVSETNDAEMSESMDGSMVDGNMVASVVERIEASVEENSDKEESDDDLSAEETLAIQLMAEVPEVATWLANFPDWSGNAWQEEGDGRFYTVDLYSEAAEEWLGWGYVNVEDEQVEDYFVPRELSAEEYQAGRELVETFVFADEEVLARLGTVENWDFETWYNRWNANWDVWFWYGLEELAVTVNIWEGEPYLEAIYNPADLEAEEAEENSKNEAISLAWEAPGIDQALAGVDNWQTYVSQQGDSLWAVSFANAEQELFFALVDIASWTVLESE
ncbi:MAG: hypothetical protein DHS20C20_26050 [Ardenticatenaceae bacterium]|nr:MAG: hypothetical protein DHS20C20_26050 [Ardenticatenaceae bacterium]